MLIYITYLVRITLYYRQKERLKFIVLYLAIDYQYLFVFYNWAIVV